MDLSTFNGTDLNFAHHTEQKSFTYNDTDLILAPVAGYSDVGMRSLCFSYGAGLCFTEMVSAQGLNYHNQNTEDLLHVGENEPFTGVQLFGRNPEMIAKAVASEQLSRFPIVDINMGCPVLKIVRTGEGSALMKEPEQAYKIVAEAKKVIGNRRLTVKIRSGFYTGYENALDVAQAVEQAGADMVTVHGRTREMFYSGNVDLNIIAKVKAGVKIPVCGNGDVTDRASYLRMKELTGVDYVMIARGAFGHPHIFTEVRGEDVDFDLKSTIKKHIEYLSFLPERVMVNSMKKHFAFYVKGIRGQKALKEKAFAATSKEELISVVNLLD